ncbi:amidase family protein, partial [Henriciella sp.]|uniref:amidase family protein n=1 Tax=Henriciella sp. TaxID=1968823 RepID=UPI0017D6477D
MKGLGDKDASALASMVRKKEISPTELLDLALESAQEAQGELNCFSSFFEDAARKQIKDGLPEGPFSGVPFAVKDLGARLKGQRITSGSRAFKGPIADL